MGGGREQGRERRGERKGMDEGNGNGHGTEKGETDGSKEANWDWKRKDDRWWVTRRSTGSSTGEGVPIRFGT